MRKAALARVLLAACVPATPAAAQEGAADTAYVESVTGRVVALVNGKPVLLDALDTVTDKTRLDVLANSELRLCHYQKQRIVALAGPARISVTASGVTAENGKDIAPSGETCAKPVVSTFQGGFVARTAGTAVTNVALRPSIKIANRSANGIRSVTLWDSTRTNIVSTFDNKATRLFLNEGQVYQLVIDRDDGSENKMTLKASATVNARPLILVVR